ncbi:MAG: thioesterase [Alphaproteobacteria bacterium]|nr:MAG: thioesterase [Alphaproteobacteria bacterium]
MPRFTTEITVRFNHVDPAGIVYYPRYYEMINQASEIWFEEGLDYPYPKMFAEGWAVPLAHLESSFKNPSFLNDRLTFAIGVTKIGRSRIDLSIITSCKQEIRFLTRQSIVWVNHKTIKSAAIPPLIRERMEHYLLSDDEDVSI